MLRATADAMSGTGSCLQWGEREHGQQWHAQCIKSFCLFTVAGFTITVAPRGAFEKVSNPPIAV